MRTQFFPPARMCRRIRGLGEPQQASGDIQKDIPTHCLLVLSEISDYYSASRLGKAHPARDTDRYGNATPSPND